MPEHPELRNGPVNRGLACFDPQWPNLNLAVDKDHKGNARPGQAYRGNQIWPFRTQTPPILNLVQYRRMRTDVESDQSQSGQVSPIDPIISSRAARHASGNLPGKGFRQTSSRAWFHASGSAFSALLPGMSDEAAECRKQAEVCSQQAERAVSPLDRDAWLRMAGE
jgi:hypothetical protein